MHAGTKASVVLAFASLLSGACREDSRLATGPVPPPLFASSSSLPHINNTNIPLPVGISATITAEECSNNPGPWITLEGVGAVGGFGVNMTFTNNMKGTHSYTDGNTVAIALEPENGSVTIPKQPVRGGTGGNPFIWVQFVNEDGSAASEEIYIGRCVQGERYGFTSAVNSLSSGFAQFYVESCENSPGPYISFDAGLTLGGIAANIIFRNNDNPVGGPHEATAPAGTVTIIPSGLSYFFPKQPVLGGVGGNPWIFAGFSDAGGAAVGEAALLGRCEQLSKALAG